MNACKKYNLESPKSQIMTKKKQRYNIYCMY